MKKKHRYYLHEYDPNIEYPDDAVFVMLDESEDWDAIMKELDEELKRLKEEGNHDEAPEIIFDDDTVAFLELLKDK